MELVCCNPGGSAQAQIIVFPPHRLSRGEAEAYVRNLSASFRTYIFSGELPALDAVEEFVQKLEHLFDASEIRHATILGVSDGATIAQAFTLAAPKTVRRLALVDPLSRIHPSLFTRAIDRIEHFLPLGLPLRRLSKNFDSRSALHRIQCPTLILCTQSASPFETAQAELLARRIPNAWLQDLRIVGDDRELGKDLVESVASFLQVPAKQPQKNRAVLRTAANETQ